MNNFLKTKYFLIPYTVAITALIYLLLHFNKMEAHLLMSQHRSTFADYFFMGYTEMGGTLPYIFIALLFLYRYSTALYLITAQLLGGIFSLALKHSLTMPRPSLYFHQFYPQISLPQVPGMHLYSTNSMPSGHTITAFALFFCLSLLADKKYLPFFYFLAAALVGYSRIYLSQHFTADVLVGSLIGIFSAVVCYPLYQKWDKKLGNTSLLRKKATV